MIGSTRETEQLRLNNELVDACMEINLKKVKKLIKEGAPVNFKEGKTLPLVAAAFYGNIEIMKFLVEECNADVNAKCNGGYISDDRNITALMATAINEFDENKCLEKINYLLKKGANPLLKSEAGMLASEFIDHSVAFGILDTAEKKKRKDLTNNFNKVTGIDSNLKIIVIHEATGVKKAGSLTVDKKNQKALNTILKNMS